MYAGSTKAGEDCNGPMTGDAAGADKYKIKNQCYSTIHTTDKGHW
jgi:hypothetical protein